MSRARRSSSCSRTKNTSQPSRVRMKPTTPHGMLASAYTLGTSLRVATGINSDASVPTTSSDRRGASRPDPAGLSVPVEFRRFVRDGLRFASLFCLTHKVGDEFVALVQELAARPAAILGTDGVLAEQRKRNRRVAVGHDGVRENTGVHFAPAHRLGG